MKNDPRPIFYSYQDVLYRETSAKPVILLKSRKVKI